VVSAVKTCHQVRDADHSYFFNSRKTAHPGSLGRIPFEVNPLEFLHAWYDEFSSDTSD
jgi:hypothetical protein